MISYKNIEKEVAGIKELPLNWELLPNKALFVERKETNYPDHELLSVSLNKGITKQSDDTDRKDTSSEDKTKYKLVKVGDLVYNKMRMWQGAIGVASDEGIVSPAYVVLNPIKLMNARYYYYLYKTPMFITESNRYSYGLCDDMNSLRYSDFRIMYSPYPPVEEQDKIVNFLDSETAKIDFITAPLKEIKIWKGESYCLQSLNMILSNDYTLKLTNILGSISSAELNIGNEAKFKINLDVNTIEEIVRLSSEIVDLLESYRTSLISKAVMGKYYL